MKIRTDFVTNSSSSSYICTLTITDKNNKKFSYSMKDAYDEDDFEQYVIERFDKDLESIKKELYLQKSIKEICELLTDNMISETYDDYKYRLEDPTDDMAEETRNILNDFINKVKKGKKKYIEKVSEKIKDISDIKNIEFYGEVHAWGEGVESVPNRMLPDNFDDSEFDGYEKDILDFKTEKIEHHDSNENN